MATATCETIELETASMDQQPDQQLEAERHLAKIARQVAHDIRSPLSALNMFIAGVDGLNDSQKELIDQVSRRINMIANDLLESAAPKKAKKQKMEESFCDLEAALSEIMREKVIEYRNNSNITLDLRFSSDVLNAKISFDSQKLKRILSNLINNSVESINGKGSVVVDAWMEQGKAFVRVTDTGRGIPGRILRKLTRERVSSKAGGHGIGVLSAWEQLKTCGHDLKIWSKERVGTQVSLKFSL